MDKTKSKTNRRLVVYSNGKLPQNAEVKPAALLLTTAPIESFKEELDGMSQLGPHFDALNTGVRLKLEHDPLADVLRASLLKFGIPMSNAAEDLSSAISKASVFYVHEWDELGGEGSDLVNTEKVSRLLDADFQARAVSQTRTIRNLIAKAARTIRMEALPALPMLERDLEQYVASYLKRLDVEKERQTSWMPSVLRDVVWGAVDPTPWKPSGVKELPQHLAQGSALLSRLTGFLDRFELHFRRLSEVTTEQILELGYATPDDLVRLYKDRLACAAVMDHMAFVWSLAAREFTFGGLEEI